jgi:hypothetical protein
MTITERVLRRCPWWLLNWLDRRLGARICWAEIVLLKTYGDARSIWDTSNCRADAEESGMCYCGKIRGEAKP